VTRRSPSWHAEVSADYTFSNWGGPPRQADGLLRDRAPVARLADRLRALGGELCDRPLVSPAPEQWSPPRGRPIAIDVFAGAGGLSLGFEQAGFDVVAALEYDPVHAATHLFNFPHCQVLCRDITRVSADELLAHAKAGFIRLPRRSRWTGQIDAVIGGPPCQGFSSGGKREGSDPRNRLLLHFVNLVETIRPRTFCLENVAGLLGSAYDDIREEAFGRLSACGYAISGTEGFVDCLDFGVPQSRQRVIVLGVLDHEAPVLNRSRDRQLTVADALAGLASPTRYPQLLSSDEVALVAADRRRRAETDSEYARRLAGIDRTPGDKSRPRYWNPTKLTGSRRTVHTDETTARFTETAPGCVEPKSHLFRLEMDGVARTLRAGTGRERGAHTSPRPIHPTEPRVITVREAARLHGYPDWFRFHTTNWHGHRQVGNSVPPPLARAAASALLKSLGCRPLAPRSTVPAADASLLGLSQYQALPIVSGDATQVPAARRSRDAGRGERV
jgi:DNA (cytosine-5)-methyltransferase 1